MHAKLRRFLSDENGRIVVAQRPNLPITLWALFTAAAWMIDGAWSGYVRFLGGAALATWAYLEITRGDSPFRRVLGTAVMVGLLLTRMPVF